MFLVDMVWLRVIAVAWYQQEMGLLLAESPNLVAAGIFYVLFPVGLMTFAVLAAEPDASFSSVVLTGALFGFFAYMTYDLSGMAVIRGWPIGLSILDIAWGSVLCGLATAAGKLSLDYLNR